MKGKYFVAGCGVLGLAALGVAAVSQGIDSGFLTSISGTIGTIIGYTFGYHKGKKK